MEIKKGRIYLCTKDVIMDGDGEIAYRSGKYYISDSDSTIEDEIGNQYHRWDDDVAEEYFTEANGAEVAKWIEENLFATTESGTKVIDTYKEYRLREAIYAIYNRRNRGNYCEADKDGRRVFNVYSESYDWADIGVYARNSQTDIFENCSCIGNVTIVLYDWEDTTKDDYDVEKELTELRKRGIKEDYTLYNGGLQLVGYVITKK